MKHFEDLIYPFIDDAFLEAWEKWKIYKKEQHRFKYKSSITEQQALKRIGDNCSNPREAIAMIDYSIAQGYQGLFKENVKGNYQKAGAVTSHNADQFRRIFGSDSKD